MKLKNSWSLFCSSAILFSIHLRSSNIHEYNIIYTISINDISLEWLIIIRWWGEFKQRLSIIAYNSYYNIQSIVNSPSTVLRRLSYSPHVHSLDFCWRLGFLALFLSLLFQNFNFIFSFIINIKLIERG